MILVSFDIRPETVKLHYNNEEEAIPTGRNTVTIEVECSDKECNELYKQFKDKEAEPSE